MTLTKREQLVRILAEEFIGEEYDLGPAAAASRRMELDRIADRITNLLAEPKAEVYQLHTDRVVQHREEQALFSVAFPASLKRALEVGVLAVVDKHYAGSLSGRHYDDVPGDCILLIRASSTNPPPVLGGAQ